MVLIKIVVTDPFYLLSRNDTLFLIPLVHLGAGDPIRQGNGPPGSRKCQFIEIHSLYTYSHKLLKIRVCQALYSNNAVAIKNSHV